MAVGWASEVWIHSEVRQAAAKPEQRFLGASVEAVLLDGVLYVLPVEGVFELGGKDRDAVQEEPQVKALLGALAVMKLAHHTKEVGFIQPLQLFVQPRHRPEVGHLKMAARFLHPAPQYIQSPAPPHLARQ